MALTEADIDRLAESILHRAQEGYVSELTTTLIDDLMVGVFGQKQELTLEALARENREHLDTALMRHRSLISDEVMESVQGALLAADAADLASLTGYYGERALIQAAAAYSTAKAQELAYQAARGIAEVIARQNIALAEQSAQAWYEAAGEAIAARDLGVKTQDRIIAEAVAKLSKAGVTAIDYRSGITNHVDVAVRRHIVTQASQAGGDMTMARLKAYGHDFVITSAHYGARPSHAEWQGRPCSLSGSKDGYPDFYAFTGYGTVTGLKGVNCKHSFGPYYPGITDLPDLSFPRESKHFGMTSEDYYDATQRQRELERRVRQTKRDIAAFEQAGLGLSSPSYVQKRLLLGRQQKALAEHTALKDLVRQPRREKAYGIGAQPRALRKKQSFPSGIFISEGATPKPKEVQVGKLIAEKKKVRVEFLKPTNREGQRTADVMVNGVKWEIKQPVGDKAALTLGKNTIDHQFESAVGQSRKLILDFRVIEEYPSVSINEAEERAVALLNGKWASSFDEVMIVRKDSIALHKNTR